MKVLPLPSPKVMLSLEYKRTMSNSDSLANPVKLRFLISTSCHSHSIDKGSPVFILAWLPLRVTPVTPGSPSIGSGSFR